MRLKIKIGTKKVNLLIGIVIKKEPRLLETKTVNLNRKFNTDFSSVLYKNLRHLDFIDKLEMNHSEQELKSMIYLKDLKNIKFQAQKNTLKLFKTSVV